MLRHETSTLNWSKCYVKLRSITSPHLGSVQPYRLSQWSMPLWSSFVVAGALALCQALVLCQGLYIVPVSLHYGSFSLVYKYPTFLPISSLPLALLQLPLHSHSFHHPTLTSPSFPKHLQAIVGSRVAGLRVGSPQESSPSRVGLLNPFLLFTCFCLCLCCMSIFLVFLSCICVYEELLGIIYDNSMSN